MLTIGGVATVASAAVTCLFCKLGGQKGAATAPIPATDDDSQTDGSDGSDESDVSALSEGSEADTTSLADGKGDSADTCLFGMSQSAFIFVVVVGLLAIGVGIALVVVMLSRNTTESTESTEESGDDLEGAEGINADDAFEEESVYETSAPLSPTNDLEHAKLTGTDFDRMRLASVTKGRLSTHSGDA